MPPALAFRNHQQIWDATYAPAALAIILAVTLARLVFLGLNPLNLYPDEAQYWYWAQDLAFGYFSKPPLIAWVIAGATGLCGDAEACVRLPAPLFHAATAGFVFLLARDLYDAKTGFWAALLYLTLPAAFLSAAIISTDVPLLTCFAAALWLLNRAMSQRRLADAALAGLAIGLGLLAKYAMAFVFAGLALAALWDRPARAFVFSRNGLAAGAVAALVVSPNVVWNIVNGFATVTHTAANANWGAELYNVDELVDFLLAQLGVFGPIPMALLVAGLFGLRWLWRGTEPSQRRADALLLGFGLPVLLVMTGQAFISRANANWAVLAYVPLTVLVVSWALRAVPRGLLAASVALHVGLGALLMALAASPALVAFADGFSEQRIVSNSFKRLTGWDAIGRLVVAQAGAAPYTAILASDREDIAELLYYARDAAPPILMWDADRIPEDHFELTRRLTPAYGARVLYLSRSPTPPVDFSRFEAATRLGDISVEIGGGRTRVFHMWELLNFRGP